MRVAAGQVVVRPCTSLADLRRCVEVQKAVWSNGWSGLTPLTVFVVATKVGGQVLGAFNGTDLLGFVMSLPAVRLGTCYLHSHILAVLPGHRNQGVGRALKIGQYKHASRRGVALIEWTFDPLDLKNAYFNIAGLGAVVRRVLPNFYGPSSSPLHGRLPTDRMLAEWHLCTSRVQSSLRGDAYVPKSNAIQLFLPLNIAEIRQVDPDEAEHIQWQLRRDLMRWLRRGYAVTAFTFDEQNGTYFLEPL